MNKYLYVFGFMLKFCKRLSFIVWIKGCLWEFVFVSNVVLLFKGNFCKFNEVIVLEVLILLLWMLDIVEWKFFFGLFFWGFKSLCSINFDDYLFNFEF